MTCKARSVNWTEVVTRCSSRTLQCANDIRH